MVESTYRRRKLFDDSDEEEDSAQQKQGIIQYFFMYFRVPADSLQRGARTATRACHHNYISACWCFWQEEANG